MAHCPSCPPSSLGGKSVPLPPIRAARRVPRICARRVRCPLACVPPPRVRSSGRCPASFARRGVSLGCPRACAQLPADGRPRSLAAPIPFLALPLRVSLSPASRVRVALPRAPRQRAARFPPASRSLAIGARQTLATGCPLRSLRRGGTPPPTAFGARPFGAASQASPVRGDICEG